MKRERALQVVLVLVGLSYSFWGYLLFDDLWHSRWLGHSDVKPMFLSLNTVLGVFLLLAVKQPVKHRSVIAYGGLVKPCPRVHDVSPIPGGRGARDAEEG
jgi:hypothetical protein